jgi:hypothetical protein
MKPVFIKSAAGGWKTFFCPCVGQNSSAAQFFAVIARPPQAQPEAGRSNLLSWIPINEIASLRSQCPTLFPEPSEHVAVFNFWLKPEMNMRRLS